MSQSGNVLHLHAEVGSASDCGGGRKTSGEREGGLLPDPSGLEDDARDLPSRPSGRIPAETSGHNLLSRFPSPASGRSTFGQTRGSPGVPERQNTPSDAETSAEDKRFDGKRSVVSFSYVQKSKVKALRGGEMSELGRKRLRDPLWCGGPSSLRGTGSRVTFRAAVAPRAPDDLRYSGSPLSRTERSDWSGTRRRSRSGSPVRLMRGCLRSPALDRRSASPARRSRRVEVTAGLNQLSGVSEPSAGRPIRSAKSGPATPQKILKMNIPVRVVGSDRTPPVERPLHRSVRPPTSASPARSPRLRVRRPSRPPTDFDSPVRDSWPSPAELQPPNCAGENRRDPGCREDADAARKILLGSRSEEAPDPGRLSSPSPETEPTRDRSGSLSPATRRKRAERRRRERLLLGPVVPDSPDEERDRSWEVPGGSSPSSSGVTGSSGDRLSPESLRSSRRGDDSGASTSGIQTDSAAPVLSLHCQKIARAKWEFLFGPPEDVLNSAEGSTAPPSGNSSESPPSSLPLAPSQHVRHVEVESASPRSPETGVVRRTLKYSETDLDAVPLRCYRETDIDELPTDDPDSAFGSNRSLCEGSPPAFRSAAGKGHPDEEEREQVEAANRAGVRMQGNDRNAAREPEGGFPGIRRASECFLDARHPALKSPVSLSGPGRAAEDTFSRHFENIVESARAKGTSYDSLDADGPAPPERPAPSDATAAADSDAARVLSGERPGGGSEGETPERRETDGRRPADAAAAKRLARRLRDLDGFRKTDVAPRLGKKMFAKEVAISGESDERERLLSHFSRRYFLCNSSLFSSEDALHTLTCALVLLNADLHGSNVGEKTSWPQFVRNLDGLNDGRRFPKRLLKALYNSIKNQKLQWTLDEEELRKSFSELGDSLSDSSRPVKAAAAGGSGDDGTADEPASRGTALYKNGFLVRKVHADCDGKRTPRGKRGWKTFYAILKGLILYLQKASPSHNSVSFKADSGANGGRRHRAQGEYRADKPLTDDDLKNAVSIHHSLAIQASDYSKRANVFYLRTADWRLFLFQAPTAEQMHSWIARINTVAATFSAPPFPPAAGSREKFSRPPLPGNVSKLSQDEQARSHEARLRAVSSELAELDSCPPDRKLKARQLDDFRRRDQHLRFEKTRYETYVALLRAKTEGGGDGGGDGGGEASEEDEAALSRTRSSPTLLDEGRAGEGKVRQDVQRHSYRQAVKK
ncbi:PH and SEC7 domain-containing protein 1-like isoform X3 [Corythoichthys intestinalis]|uniref:PH and SEC7 domain-containing protein 1-like isoform X3 n=1 Tax=Corythoichthys intestinalis TaxID=161448 RepID=UPI0025A559DD|nr:PH and SEC7 domain-containing protein 1-like isoform X3 [Corythoichthys intestinalis]